MAVKIIILSQIFWPENHDYKNRILAAELAARGHEVKVVTAFPSYPLGRVFAGYRQRLLQREQVDGFEIFRVPIYPDHSASGIKRVLNYFSFAASASTLGLAASGKADVVLVHATPMTVGWAAGVFGLVKGAPVIMDVVDLWPDAVTCSEMVTSDKVYRITGFIAKIAYKFATIINVPTVGFRDALLTRGVPAKKLRVVPIWADKTIFHEADRDPDFGRQYGLAGKFCLVYTGNMGPMQDVGNIVKAAALLTEYADIRFVMVGGGQNLEKLRRLAAELNLSNVVFTGPLPVERMSGILAWADGLLVNLMNDPYLLINFPSKITGYMAAGRPIIAAADGEARRITLEHDIGLVCRPGNPAELADTIIKFYHLPAKERNLMGVRSKQAFDAYYDKDVILQKYVNQLAGI
jgi:Glycosyltransferase